MKKSHSAQTPDYDWALKKMMYFCAFQERCISEVEAKLREFNLQPKISNEILEKLIADDYLNEERFARQFSGGKFRINKWGRNKIIHALRLKKVPEIFINSGICGIDEEEYMDQLIQLIVRKKKEINESNAMKRSRLLANFAISKGYEPDLVWDIINLKE